MCARPAVTVALLVCIAAACVRPVRADDEIDSRLLAILLPTLLGVFLVIGIVLGVIVYYQKKRSRQRRARRQELGIHGYTDADEVAMEPGVEPNDTHRHSRTASRRPTPPTRGACDEDAGPEVGGVGAQDRLRPHADLRHRHREGDGSHDDDPGHSFSSGTHSPTPLTGVAIENRVRPRNRLPKGTVLVEQEDLQYRIDFNRLHDIPEAAPPPLSREERKRLEEEQNRVASPLFYGRAEYLHGSAAGSRAGSVRGFGSFMGSYAGSYAGSVDGRASVDAFRHSVNASPYRPPADGADASGVLTGLRRQGSASSMASMANASFGEPRRLVAPRDPPPKPHKHRHSELLESTSDDFDGVEDEAAMAVRAGLRQRHVTSRSTTSPSAAAALPPRSPQGLSPHSHSRVEPSKVHSGSSTSLSQTPLPQALPPGGGQGTALEWPGHRSPHAHTGTHTLEASGTSSLTDYFTTSAGAAAPAVDFLTAHVTPVTAAPPRAEVGVPQNPASAVPLARPDVLHPAGFTAPHSSAEESHGGGATAPRDAAPGSTF